MQEHKQLCKRAPQKMVTLPQLSHPHWASAGEGSLDSLWEGGFYQVWLP